jgi:hypothetical protein
MIAFPTFTSGSCSISRFTVSIGSGSGLTSTSGAGTGRGAGLGAAAGGGGAVAARGATVFGTVAAVAGAAVMGRAAVAGDPDEDSRGAALGSVAGGGETGGSAGAALGAATGGLETDGAAGTALGTTGIVVDAGGGGGAALGAALSVAASDGCRVGGAFLAPSDDETWAPGVGGGGALVGARGAEGIAGMSVLMLVGPGGGRAGPSTSEGRLRHSGAVGRGGKEAPGDAADRGGSTRASPAAPDPRRSGSSMRGGRSGSDTSAVGALGGVRSWAGAGGAWDSTPAGGA